MGRMNTHMAVDGTSPQEGSLFDADSNAQHVPQRNGRQLQQAAYSVDQRMGDASENSSNNEDSDSCRSGDSDGEGDTMRSGSNRGMSAAVTTGSAAANGSSGQPVPLRQGAWAASQPMPIKAESSGGHAQSGGNSAGKACGRAKKPHLKGRFSGRLETKRDEKLLADECKLLGPMLGGSGKRGEKSRLTLAKIVRGIAAGDVRRFCEDREQMLQSMKSQVEAWQTCGEGQALSRLQQENTELRMQLKAKQQQLGSMHQGDTAAAPAASSQLPGTRALSSVDLPVLLSASAASAGRDLGMPPLPLLQARPLAVGGPVVSLPLAPAASSGSGLLQRQISANAQMAQAAATAAAQAAPAQDTSGASAENLKAHASALKAHADNLNMQQHSVASDPAKVQVAVKARCLHAQAQSLEAQAEAQTLQAHAQAHSDAHAATRAQAEQLAQRAEAHGQAQAQAVEAAHRLKRVASMGETRLLGLAEAGQEQNAAVQAHSLEAQALAHAEAQAHTIAHVQSLEAQAQAHAQQAHQAQAQAHSLSVQAHSLQATAQHLDTKAHEIMVPEHQPPPLPMQTLQTTMVEHQHVPEGMVLQMPQMQQQQMGIAASPRSQTTTPKATPPPQVLVMQGIGSAPPAAIPVGSVLLPAVTSMQGQQLYIAQPQTGMHSEQQHMVTHQLVSLPVASVPMGSHHAQLSPQHATASIYQTVPHAVGSVDMASLADSGHEASLAQARSQSQAQLQHAVAEAQNLANQAAEAQHLAVQAAQAHAQAEEAAQALAVQAQASERADVQSRAATASLQGAPSLASHMGEAPSLQHALGSHGGLASLAPNQLQASAASSMQAASSMMVQQGSLMGPAPTASLPPSGPGSRRAGTSLSAMQQNSSSLLQGSMQPGSMLQQQGSVQQPTSMLQQQGSVQQPTSMLEQQGSLQRQSSIPGAQPLGLVRRDSMNGATASSTQGPAPSAMSHGSSALPPAPNSAPGGQAPTVDSHDIASPPPHMQEVHSSTNLHHEYSGPLHIPDMVAEVTEGSDPIEQQAQQQSASLTEPQPAQPRSLQQHMHEQHSQQLHDQRSQQQDLVAQHQAQQQQLLQQQAAETQQQLLEQHRQATEQQQQQQQEAGQLEQPQSLAPAAQDPASAGAHTAPPPVQHQQMGSAFAQPAAQQLGMPTQAQLHSPPLAQTTAISMEDLTGGASQAVRHVASAQQLASMGSAQHLVSLGSTGQQQAQQLHGAASGLTSMHSLGSQQAGMLADSPAALHSTSSQQHLAAAPQQAQLQPSPLGHKQQPMGQLQQVPESMASDQHLLGMLDGHSPDGLSIVVPPLEPLIAHGQHEGQLSPIVGLHGFSGDTPQQPYLLQPSSQAHM